MSFVLRHKRYKPNCFRPPKGLRAYSSFSEAEVFDTLEEAEQSRGLGFFDVVQVTYAIKWVTPGTIVGNYVTATSGYGHMWGSRKNAQRFETAKAARDAMCPVIRKGFDGTREGAHVVRLMKVVA